MKAFFHWLKNLFEPKQMTQLHHLEEAKIQNQVKFRHPPAA